MNFTSIDLDSSPTTLNCSFLLDKSERVLWVKVKGNYRKGSEGGRDAQHIFTSTVAYYFGLSPEILVFDFSEMVYEWGNSLIKILKFNQMIGRDEAEKNMPMAFVVSPKNLDAIAGLLGGDAAQLPENFFQNSEEVVRFVEDLLED